MRHLRLTTVVLALLSGFAAFMLCLSPHRGHGTGGRPLVLRLRAAWSQASLGPMRDSLSGGLSTELVGKHHSLGPEACALCHIEGGAARAKALWAPSAGASEGGVMPAREPSSAVCLSCHDGTLAGASGVPGNGSGIGGSHPIGTDYAQAWASHPRAYHPPGGVMGAKLEDGKVGCLSCHRLHGPADPFGRPTVVESACESCHIR